MSEESTTPDLVERVRRSVEAATVGDFDFVARFYAPDAVWDMSPMGMGVFESPAAIRGFFDDWVASYEEFEVTAEEIIDLGGGVTFAIFSQTGRPVGSSGRVTIRYGSLGVWRDGLILRTVNYGDIDEGRAAAVALAESRG